LIGRLTVGFLDPVSPVAVGADRDRPGGQLSLQESGDHLRRGYIVLLVADRTGTIHLLAGIRDIGPGRTDVFVVGMPDAWTMTPGARDSLELMAPGQWLLHEGQVTDEAGSARAQDVRCILVGRRLTGGRCGTKQTRGFHASWPDRGHAEAGSQNHERQRGQEAQTVSQSRSHWYPGVKWAR